MTASAPRFRDLGDTALTVEFGDRIDPLSEARVRALDAALARNPPDGVAETVPTYRSLTVHFDPDVISAEALERAIRPLLSFEAAPTVARRWRVPVCYDPALAEDLDEAAALARMPPARLCALHAGADWRVAMFGFAPGFTYLSGCPKALDIPRRTAPRPPFPPGSVMIAAGQSLIAPSPMPTGWYVIGRTPLATFRPEAAEPFPLSVGDAITFEPVDAAAFAALSQRAAAGEFVATRA